MPAKSQAQQRAAGAALAAKRGDAPKSGLRGASRSMLDMGQEELEKFAGTRRRGLPARKGESLASAIVDALLAEDHEDAAEEGREVSAARSILGALRRLQSSLANATPEQQRALTTIRAAAHALIRIHR